MRFYIPSIGDKIKLLSDWTFTLQTESRNHIFFQNYIPDHPYSKLSWRQSFYAYREMNEKVWYTLPAGQILVVDRIYIRQNKPEFDSITFRLHSTNKKNKGRFWVSLSDTRNMEVELVEK